MPGRPKIWIQIQNLVQECEKPPQVKLDRIKGKLTVEIALEASSENG